MSPYGSQHSPAGGVGNGYGLGGGAGERDHIPQSSTGSTGSRNSMSTGPRMPSIAEDESSYRASHQDPSQSNVIWPRTPLRVPQKSPRRALTRPQAQPYAQAETSSSKSGAHHYNGNLHAAAPPPYVPAAAAAASSMPPQYKETSHKVPSPPSDSSSSSELKASKSMGVSSVPSRSSPTPLGSRPDELGEKTPGWMDRQWHGSRRSRYFKFGALVLVLIAIIVGLTVGLTVGMKKG